MDELVADVVPDDPGHLVAVELDDRVRDLDPVHSSLPSRLRPSSIDAWTMPHVPFWPITAAHDVSSRAFGAIPRHRPDQPLRHGAVRRDSPRSRGLSLLSRKSPACHDRRGDRPDANFDRRRSARLSWCALSWPSTSGCAPVQWPISECRTSASSVRARVGRAGMATTKRRRRRRRAPPTS